LVMLYILYIPENLVHLIGHPPPFDAPLSEGFPYPVVTELVAIYTLMSSAAFFVLFYILGQLRRLASKRRNTLATQA
ncbi:MAG TPA: hypothetical protein VN181_02495, partial [Thermoanaerobaculia bacterium]|nr:hypothetical protein [Thermoanaerobaculia bacterium]